MAEVLSLEDGGGEGQNHWYKLVLPEGRNREVRRIFEALNLMVSRLLRIRYGPVQLPPRLKRGQLLEMRDAEVRALLDAVGIDADRFAGDARPQKRGGPALGRISAPNSSAKKSRHAGEG